MAESKRLSGAGECWMADNHTTARYQIYLFFNNFHITGDSYHVEESDYRHGHRPYRWRGRYNEEEDIEIPDGINNYGMILKRRGEKVDESTLQ